MLAYPRETLVHAGNPLGVYYHHDIQPSPLDTDMHGTFEVGVLLSGKNESHFQGGTRLMGVGDVYLCSAWEPHGWRILQSQTSTILWEFRPEVLGEAEVAGRPWPSLFAAHAGARPRVRTARMRQEVLAIARATVREFEEARPAWLEVARLNLLLLLVTLAREWEPPAEYQRRPVRALDLERVLPALNLMEAPGADLRRISREEAAAACALSESHFGAVFQHAMGVSFGQFELKTRLAHAARLLLYSDLSVEAIAAETGFVDGSHLSRVFPKYYGCTPAQYRADGRHTRRATDPRAQQGE